MFEVYMLQPVTTACDGLIPAGRRCCVPEPDLDELMHDPMTLALMAADRVDHRELDALFSRVRQHLC